MVNDDILKSIMGSKDPIGAYWGALGQFHEAYKAWMRDGRDREEAKRLSLQVGELCIIGDREHGSVLQKKYDEALKKTFEAFEEVVNLEKITFDLTEAMGIKVAKH
ncbi:hypothetical protein HYS50_00440 [Candidatus Woesearchaeota archaeon]|nr:hypothetical protein [Candidatus Woesearchaeota archaeon]